MSQVNEEFVAVEPPRGMPRPLMFMILYPDYLKHDVVELLDQVGVAGFTEIQKVNGRGPRGMHFGSQVWPGSDEVIYTAVTPDQAKTLAARLAEFSRSLEARSRGLYGLHVFTWPCNQLF